MPEIVVCLKRRNSIKGMVLPSSFHVFCWIRFVVFQVEALDFFVAFNLILLSQSRAAGLESSILSEKGVGLKNKRSYHNSRVGLCHVGLSAL